MCNFFKKFTPFKRKSYVKDFHGFDRITYETHGHCWIPTRHKNGVITRRDAEWALCDYVYHTQVRNLKPYEFVVHTCGDHRCINPDHLTAVNMYDNIYDGTPGKHALIVRAKLHGNMRLGEHDAKFIRESRASAELLAHMYSVDLEVILEIKRGNTWNGAKLR